MKNLPVAMIAVSVLCVIFGPAIRSGFEGVQVCPDVSYNPYSPKLNSPNREPINLEAFLIATKGTVTDGSSVATGQR